MAEITKYYNTKTFDFINKYSRNGLVIPLEPIKSRMVTIRGYSIEYKCSVLLNIDGIMSGKWIDFRSIIYKTQYFINTYCRSGEIIPLGQIDKRMSKVICYSEKFNCDVLVDVNHIMRGGWIDFSNIIDKTQYFIDNYCRDGLLVPLEKIKKRKSKIKCYSKEFNCNVLVSIHHIMGGGWIDFKSIIDKTQYFIDNYCRDGLLVPLEPITKSVSKVKCYSKELNSEILVSVRDVIKGNWVISGWFHNMAKKNPNRISYLYVVQLSYNSESFYKVGVTTIKNKKRYKGYGKYEVTKELIWVEDTASNISKLEIKILRECKINYTPKYNFDGKTEIVDIFKIKSLNLLPQNINI